MKQFISLLMAGMIGGLTFFGIQQMYTPKVVKQDVATVVKASHTDAVVGGADFVKASELATDVVVHIYAEESKDNARERMKNQRRSNPFADLFGDDFFGGDFFGRSPFGNFHPQNGTGSGVIVSEDGYIVTNNHVVGFADNIVVTLNDGRKVDAYKVGTDPSTDLAVIKIDLDERFRVLRYADSDRVKVGEWVLAVGNPFSYLKSTVTAGIVSAKGRDLDIIKEESSIEEFIQTDAVVNPGNSGGALVNVDGELIGINTAIATPTGSYAGYSFAIPSNMVKRIVNDIKENGDIERVNLGLGGYDVDDKLKKELNLTVNKGFYILDVQQRSTAQLSGLLPGDVIVAVDDKAVTEYDDIKEIMKYSKAGDQMIMEVIRNGKKKDVPIKLRKSF